MIKGLKVNDLHPSYSHESNMYSALYLQINTQLASRMSCLDFVVMVRVKQSNALFSLYFRTSDRERLRQTVCREDYGHLHSPSGGSWS